MADVWSLEKLIDVLDRSVLLDGPVGFGPILPRDANGNEYFEAPRCARAYTFQRLPKTEIRMG